VDVTIPAVEARLREGRIRTIGAASTIDAEAVVAARPDLLMTSGQESAALATVRAGGVPVVANLEWLEDTPLGRAEWVKLMGLFLNEEARAAAQYAAVRARYEAMRERTQAIPAAQRPRVMTGRGPHGQFYIAGGRSYVARLIRDAGGRYVWDDNEDPGMPLIDLEAQLRRAGDADVWINGGGWKDRAAILAHEPRYAQFKAFRDGQVWVYEKKMTASGGNDYWSRSVTRPDLVLADLIKIFHPRLLPEHAFEWYMPVPR
jgi:iron complex transport system substrate-binding protein